MGGYSRGASIVIQALQAVENERGTIWGEDMFQVLLRLSPADSVLARVIRLDRVRDRTMRDQFRDAFSGRSEIAYLNRPSLPGFQLVGDLLERAQRFSTLDESDVITERHLARALVDMLGEALRKLNIDGQRLIAEVTAVEGSPEEKRVRGFDPRSPS